MSKRYIFWCSLATICILGCNPEKEIDYGEVCTQENESKCIDGNYLVTCVKISNDNDVFVQSYKKCETGCNETTNRCNECNDNFSASCNGANRRYCESGSIEEEVCSMICANGECVECTDENVTRCYRPDNAIAICIIDSDKDKKQCDFKCNPGYVMNSDHTGCEPFVCTEQDVSGCPEPPENAISVCKQITCEEGEDDCEPASVCDFKCNEDFATTSNGKGCEPFVCNNNDLKNCESGLPEFAVATCSRNKCDFECDEEHVRNGNECVVCTSNNTARCKTIANSSVSCVNQTCQYTCLEGCYKWDEQTHNCVIIDEDQNKIPDCYDTIDCEANNIICLRTADDFLHLPDYFDSNGKVKSSYEGKYSNKSPNNVTFYLMNDINLKDIVPTFSDANSHTCSAVSWNAPELKNLVLKTPLDSDKRIYYQDVINGQNIDCTMTTSLWKSLESSSVSHLKIEFDVQSNTAHSAFVEKITDSELYDVSYKGYFENRTDVEKLTNFGAIAGEAIDCILRRVYCDGASYYMPADSYNTGCVIGWMQGGELSNEADGDKPVVVNHVVSADGDYVVGGLIGKVSASAKGKALVRKVINQIDHMEPHLGGGGLIGYVENAEIYNIENEVKYLGGSVECGGLIGNVGSTSHIHDVLNTIGDESSKSYGIKGDNFGVDNNYPKRLGGLIGCVHASDSEGKYNIDNNNIRPENIEGLEKTEIYNITQKVKANITQVSEDSEMVIGDDIITGDNDIGGLIGCINPDRKHDYDVVIQNVDNEMLNVSANTGNAGGLIAVAMGGETHKLSIKNVTNKVKTVNAKVDGAGFVAYATDTNFENITNQFEQVDAEDDGAGFVAYAANSNFKSIDNQFERVSGVGQVGGFVGYAQACNFENIKNVNVSKGDEQFYGVYKKNTIATIYNRGTGGFANLIRDKSSLNNIDNEIYSVKNDDSNCDIAGFVNKMNSYYQSGNISDENVININNVTNKINNLESNNLLVTGFSSSMVKVVIYNCINEIDELSGKNVAGFVDSITGNSINYVQSTVKNMAATNNAAGFALSINDVKMNGISSVVQNMEVTKANTTSNNYAYGFGGVKSQGGSLSDISSAAMIKVPSDVDADNVPIVDVSGAMDGLGEEYLNNIKFERFVSYADIMRGEKKVKDAQISMTAFTPADGSSIRYNEPGEGYSAMPGSSQCGVCVGYSNAESVGAVVQEFNGKNGVQWKAGRVKVGETTVEMPVIELENIGFSEPEGGIGYKAQTEKSE